MEFTNKEITLKDGRSCLLRSPSLSDTEAMLQYLKLTSEETYFMLRYPEEACMSAEEEAVFLGNALKSRTEVMIAAFVEGELAGNAGVRGVSGFQKLKHRAVFGISIKEKYWNIGIGSALLTEIIGQTKAMGYEQLELGVFSDNAKARRLYERFGFEPWGAVKNAYKLKDGTYRDEILMGRML